MGEIANDLVNGACCSWCSKYFKKEHGYPVICKECFEEWCKEEHGNKNKLSKLGLQIALESELD